MLHFHAHTLVAKTGIITRRGTVALQGDENHDVRCTYTVMKALKACTSRECEASARASAKISIVAAAPVLISRQALTPSRASNHGLMDGGQGVSLFISLLNS